MTPSSGTHAKLLKGCEAAMEQAEKIVTLFQEALKDSHLISRDASFVLLRDEIAAALRERDEETATWQDRAAINGKEAWRFQEERDQARTERDAAVEALERVTAQDTTRGYPTGIEWMRLATVAREALASLPHAAERARLVASVVAAARDVDENGDDLDFCRLSDALADLRRALDTRAGWRAR